MERGGASSWGAGSAVGPWRVWDPRWCPPKRVMRGEKGKAGGGGHHEAGALRPGLLPGARGMAQVQGERRRVAAPHRGRARLIPSALNR